METTMRDKRPFWRSRWWMPLFTLALGGAMFAAYAIGGDAGEGVFAFGVMAAVAALFFFGGRSETLRGLGGPGRDERWAAIDLQATAFAGLVALTAAIGAFLWEIANGDDGSPYAQICAVGGVAYVVAVAFLRWRS
jgi:drug/metabolite transporter (DMT)-like permease